MKSKLLLMIACFFLINSCGTVPITGRKQMLLMSDQEILSMSQQSFTDYMKSAKPSIDKRNTQMVLNVGTKMSKAVEEYLKINNMEGELKNFKWEFHLVKDSVPNAFCMPGGKIVVNEGILKYTRNEDGLAVVVGHEIAHAVAKHSNERMSQQMVAQLGVAAVGVALSGKSASTQAVATTVFGLGAQVGVMLPFSRKHEYEADKLGLIFMAMSGYNLNEAPDFWTRMSSMSKGGSIPEFMSTHPADENRIAELKKAMPEAERFKK